MNFLQSTVGKKIVVAVTGAVMFGFVIGHLAGNLQVFLGPAALNDYSDFLHNDTHGMIWVARAVLLISVILHVLFTIQLNRRNRASRPVGYAQHAMMQASRPSRVMIWSGAFLGLYIVYHVLHLTFGWAHPGFSPNNVYANLVVGFRSWPASFVYILAMISLGMHLHHGIASMFQTLGLVHPKYETLRRRFAVGSSVAIAAGYSAIPLGVLFGVIRF